MNRTKWRVGLILIAILAIALAAVAYVAFLGWLGWTGVSALGDGNYTSAAIRLGTFCLLLIASAIEKQRSAS